MKIRLWFEPRRNKCSSSPERPDWLWDPPTIHAYLTSLQIRKSKRREIISSKPGQRDFLVKPEED
jgi:hypothetical protein